MAAKTTGVPKLPVPPLAQTIQKYLKTVVPLATSQAELENTRALAARFQEDGTGARLQAGLQEHAANKDNWLESWWLSVAYLTYRSPVVVHSNPGFTFVDPEPREDVQVKRAAEILFGMLAYKEQVDSGSIAVETVRNAPLCMGQYDRIFSACRIPRPGEDELKVYPRSESRHVIVAHAGQFFSIDVYNHATGKPLAIKDLEQQLRAVVATPVIQPNTVGLLTSEHRDIWATLHADLEKNATNRKTLETIRRAILVLNLDAAAPRTHTETIELTIHGGGAAHASANRWFDKMQVIVAKNGKGGILFEHSPLDAVVGINMMEAATAELCHGAQPAPLGPAAPAPTLLAWELTPAIDAGIRAAAANLDTLVNDVSFQAFHITTFGKDQMKKHGLSPDAFFQIALQLAYYRLHGRACGTYETAHTRLFARGRTETIRTASSASLAFVKAMDCPAATRASRAKLFREAVAAHSDYTREAMEGRGIDRHLLGLRLIARQRGEPMHAFFTDPLFARSSTWNLSTSTVPMAHNSFPAFGPVVADGYGLCYNVKPDAILAGISSFRTLNGGTSAARLAETLRQSLLDINLTLTEAKL